VSRAVLEVTHEELLVRLVVETPLSRVDALLTDEPIKTTRQNVPGSPSAADTFKGASLEQGWHAVSKLLRQRHPALQMIEHQKIVGGEEREALLPQSLQKPDESRVAHFAAQCQGDLMPVTARKVRRRLTLSDAALEHSVRPLARPFHEPASLESLCNAPVPGRLPVQDVLWGYTGRKAARAYDLERTGELSHEDRAAEPVVSMAHGVQDGFAHHSFVERFDIQYEQAVAELLDLVPQANRRPQVVVP